MSTATTEPMATDASIVMVNTGVPPRRRGRPPKTAASIPSAASPAAASDATLPLPSPAPPPRIARPPVTVPRLAGQASERARLVAAAVLDVLAGVRTPADAAAALGLAPVRYYQIETRAMGGLLRACEPAERGRRPAASDDGAAAKQAQETQAENKRLTIEVARLGALLRTARTAFGLRPPPTAAATASKTAGKTGPKRIRKPRVRALRLAGLVRRGDGDAPASAVPAAAPPAATA